MADRSCKTPLGIVEDVKVKVGKFTFPVDFVIMQIEDKDAPIILGRPFLATGNTLINVQEGKLSFKVGTEKIIFDMKKMMRIPRKKEYKIDFENDWERNKDYERKNIINIEED